VVATAMPTKHPKLASRSTVSAAELAEQESWCARQAHIVAAEQEQGEAVTQDPRSLPQPYRFPVRLWRRTASA